MILVLLPRASRGFTKMSVKLMGNMNCNTKKATLKKQTKQNRTRETIYVNEFPATTTHYLIERIKIERRSRILLHSNDVTPKSVCGIFYYVRNTCSGHYITNAFNK